MFIYRATLQRDKPRRWSRLYRMELRLTSYASDRVTVFKTRRLRALFDGYLDIFSSQNMMRYNLTPARFNVEAASSIEHSHGGRYAVTQYR